MDAKTASFRTRDIARTVERYMHGAGLSLNRFNKEQASFWMGRQVENLATKLKELADSSIGQHQRDSLRDLARTLDDLVAQFDNGMLQGNVLRADHGAMMACDFDIAFASVASIFSTATDGEGAIAQGCFTALDQFELSEECSLRMCRDEKGHPKKRDGWKEADFSRFVDPLPHV